MIRFRQDHRRRLGAMEDAKGDSMTTFNETTESAAEDNEPASPPFEQPSHCLLCGQVGPVLLYGHWVCDHCKNVVQAEALAKRRKIEKEGGGPPLTR